MSATNPIVTVYYPWALWLAWLPRCLWRPKYNTKLVRIQHDKPYYFDPECNRIEQIQTPFGVAYYQVR